MESYKNTSRLITILSFIATCASYITVDQLMPLLPTEFKIFAPTIVAVIAYIASQLSEEKRVIVAETIKTSDGEVCDSAENQKYI